MPSSVPDDVEEEFEVKEKPEETQEEELNFKGRCFKYVCESSLLIFHRDSRIRQCMINLTTSNCPKKKLNKREFLMAQIQALGHADSDEDEEENFYDQLAQNFNASKDNEDQLSPISFCHKNTVALGGYKHNDDLLDDENFTMKAKHARKKNP